MDISLASALLYIFLNCLFKGRVSQFLAYFPCLGTGPRWFVKQKAESTPHGSSPPLERNCRYFCFYI